VPERKLFTNSKSKLASNRPQKLPAIAKARKLKNIKNLD
jgi:hypothetical protein